MKCKTVLKNLSAFVDNELNNDFKNNINNHLNQCADCKKEYLSYIKINSLLQNPVPGRFDLSYEALTNIINYDKTKTNYSIFTVLKPALLNMAAILIIIL